MARWRERVRLEDGLKLDLNKLVRAGLAKRGEERQRCILLDADFDRRDCSCGRCRD